MPATYTTKLCSLQPICNRSVPKKFVALWEMKLPGDPGLAGRWTKEQREARGISARELADRINGLAHESGDPTIVSQQVVSKFEQGTTKRLPAWARFIVPAFKGSDSETKEDVHLSSAYMDNVVAVHRLPNFVGMGGGGSDHGELGSILISRDLVERELRASPSDLLAMEAEGNSMEPEFRGGDQILVDTRRKSLAQPGAFCLWDGDGYVIKYLQKVADSDPPKIRVISLNPLYKPHEVLADEVNLIGRVVWFGRRVQ